ncbi:MAG: type I-E CRISPR-associated protein Cas7/Cse4/CasC [Oceanipulchritudo sp.]
MFIELHLIQNFAPSCLNRDDSNTPKECDFGGYRRARISSQCLKRAARDYFKHENMFSEEEASVRTKLLKTQLVEQIKAEKPESDLTEAVVEVALEGLGFGLDGERTQYLLFLGRQEIADLSSKILEHWSDLEPVAAKRGEGEKNTDKKEAKKKGKKAVPAAVSQELKAALQPRRSPEIAMFGRMLADLPQGKVDGSCQVAHAISTNKVDTEFDFYTAVDDLQREEETGAGMMGTIEFNSACFYRYANVNLDQLQHLLGNDNADLTRKSADAFLRAMINAVPSGKQNSMAAHNPPSFIFGVARTAGLWSLANAFVAPVRPRADLDLVSGSIEALKTYWSRLAKAYGAGQIQDGAVLHLNGTIQGEPWGRFSTGSVDELVNRLVRKAFPETK